ncbi:DNA-binding response regulator, OmpR family, contains REC and winged-helix (wHTH) domain [Williamsia serinedens]|uniref:DNA-binding response regulator, OmpR family, contains REC and winged-helix (WHTH) domain n=2 Tax=Williamsia serinedens TaxID=391736 RepID=A0ABT1GYS0_9NOCA|nr:DNA-binding response regulator, OmpR family, contains REC and winged-helix (wHTH) domain [Williamsia serinedens]
MIGSDVVDRPAPLRDDVGMGVDEGGGAFRALVVEDEVDLAQVVVSYLDRAGFAVEHVVDGLGAVERARASDPHVVVLDLGLPSLDGIEVCRRLRMFSDAYVVMLTARSDEVDTLVGLGVGADDYVTKPFSPRELTARVQAMMRRPRTAQHTGPRNVIVIGDLEINLDAREVRAAGGLVPLTRTEFDVLEALARHRGVVLTRHQLIEMVWGAGWVGDAHLIDTHVGHLRRKLGDDAAVGKYIRTARGVGYRMGEG